jgi:hypothetical protein
MPYASVLTTYGPPGALAWSPVARLAEVQTMVVRGGGRSPGVPGR